MSIEIQVIKFQTPLISHSTLATLHSSETESSYHLDQNEKLLKLEEEKLEEELRELHIKNDEVTLVYDSVTENIKNLIKNNVNNTNTTENRINSNNSLNVAMEKKEEKKDDNIQISTTQNNQELTTSDDIREESTIYKEEIKQNDDEIVKAYNGFLTLTKNNLDTVFLSVSFN